MREPWDCFSKREEEPSHSRAWIAQNGELARKTQLTLAIVARLTRVPEGQAGAWGTSLEDGGLTVAHEVFADAVRQDVSLARHVARDLILMFEANGGLTVAHADAFASIGLDPSRPLRPGFGSPGESVGGAAAAVARTIQARSEGGEAASADLDIYIRLFEDRSDEAHEWALDVGAWSALVLARMASTERLMNFDLFLRPGADRIAAMEAVGWYPNPVNAGDTSMGDAQIQRTWDGEDWTDLVRLFDGRDWTKTEVSLFTTPRN